MNEIFIRDLSDKVSIQAKSYLQAREKRFNQTRSTRMSETDPELQPSIMIYDAAMPDAAATDRVRAWIWIAAGGLILALTLYSLFIPLIEAIATPIDEYVANQNTFSYLHVAFVPVGCGLVLTGIVKLQVIRRVHLNADFLVVERTLAARNYGRDEVATPRIGKGNFIDRRLILKDVAARGHDPATFRKLSIQCRRGRHREEMAFYFSEAESVKQVIDAWRENEDFSAIWSRLAGG